MALILEQFPLPARSRLRIVSEQPDHSIESEIYEVIYTQPIQVRNTSTTATSNYCTKTENGSVFPPSRAASAVSRTAYMYSGNRFFVLPSTVDVVKKSRYNWYRSSARTVEMRYACWMFLLKENVHVCVTIGKYDPKRYTGDGHDFPSSTSWNRIGVECERMKDQRTAIQRDVNDRQRMDGNQEAE